MSIFRDDGQARRELRAARLREAVRIRDLLAQINSRPGHVIHNIGGLIHDSKEIEEAFTGLIEEMDTEIYYEDMAWWSRRTFG